MSSNGERSRWTEWRKVLRKELYKRSCRCPYHNNTCTCKYHYTHEKNGCCTFHQSAAKRANQTCNGCIYHTFNESPEISDTCDGHKSELSSFSSISESHSVLSQQTTISETTDKELPRESELNESCGENDNCRTDSHFQQSYDGSEAEEELQEENDSVSCETIIRDYTPESYSDRSPDISSITEVEESGGGTVTDSYRASSESSAAKSDFRSGHLESQDDDVHWNTSGNISLPDGDDPGDPDSSSSEGNEETQNSNSRSENSESDDYLVERNHRGISPPDDDPDHSDGNNSAENNQDSAEEFSFAGDMLGPVLEMVRECTAHEAFLLVIALAVRHNYTYESILDIFRVLNTIFGKKYFPASKKTLWRILKLESSKFKKHAYCAVCSRSLGLLNTLPELTVCPCGQRILRKKARYFITLGLKSQLKYFLKLPGTFELLQYRLTRQKRNPHSIEDIFDGTEFRKLHEAPRLSPFDYTYLLNTDGFSLTESSGLCAWPLYIRLNEVPPYLRQKTIFLAGLWVDYREPDFNLVLEPFVDEANKLSMEGILWRPDGFEEDIISRFFPTCSCVDAKARAPMLNMMLFNGYYGCTFCQHRGVYLSRSMRYPVPGSVITRQKANQEEERILVPETEDRTDESIRAGMISATPDSPVNGIKGPSELMNLQYFDLGNGFSTDDLHNLFEGVTKFHTELLLDKSGTEYYIGSKENLSVIGARLLDIKTPTKISRKPRAIGTRTEWTGTEWRNWLLFYSTLCLLGLFTQSKYLSHFALLVHAVFLLSRDVIEEDDFREADRCLRDYVRLFQEYFGAERMRYNIHLLTHVCACVRKWGPLFTQSTFGFESRNRHLEAMVKSPKGAIDQIVRRYYMLNCVSFVALDDSVAEELRDKISAILNGHKTNGRSIQVGSARLFDEVARRQPTDEERELLAGRACDSLVEYRRVLCKNVECRSALYEDDARSDDRHVYTWDDEFCTISCIVVLEDGDNKTCGMFVDVYEVGDPVLQVSHIVPLTGNSSRQFISVNSIRNSAIKLTIAEITYMLPMHNQVELD